MKKKAPKGRAKATPEAAQRARPIFRVRSTGFGDLGPNPGVFTPSPSMYEVELEWKGNIDNLPPGEPEAYARDMTSAPPSWPLHEVYWDADRLTVRILFATYPRLTDNQALSRLEELFQSRHLPASPREPGPLQRPGKGHPLSGELGAAETEGLDAEFTPDLLIVDDCEKALRSIADDMQFSAAGRRQDLLGLIDMVASAKEVKLIDEKPGPLTAWLVDRTNRWFVLSANAYPPRGG